MNHIGTREIATERLTLRRFEIEDAENVFYNWFSDEQTVKYLTLDLSQRMSQTVLLYLRQSLHMIRRTRHQ